MEIAKLQIHKFACNRVTQIMVKRKVEGDLESSIGGKKNSGSVEQLDSIYGVDEFITAEERKKMASRTYLDIA